MAATKKPVKDKLFLWASFFALAICFVYTLYRLATSVALFSFVEKILFGSLGIAVCAIAVFFLLARMGYNLELNMVKGNYMLYLSVGLLVAICALAVGVVLVILGFVHTLAIVPISILLLSLCIVFSSEFFNMKRVPFSVRLFTVALIIGLLIGVIEMLA
jgi:hypothetical protein